MTGITRRLKYIDSIRCKNMVHCGIESKFIMYDGEFRVLADKYDAKNMKGVHPEGFMR